jgi:hypothetical protein
MWSAAPTVQDMWLTRHFVDAEFADQNFSQHSGAMADVELQLLEMLCTPILMSLQIVVVLRKGS